MSAQGWSSHELLGQINLLPGQLKVDMLPAATVRCTALHHLGMAIAQDVGANAHDGHIGVFIAIQIPHLAALSLS